MKHLIEILEFNIIFILFYIFDLDSTKKQMIFITERVEDCRGICRASYLWGTEIGHKSIVPTLPRIKFKKIINLERDLLLFSVVQKQTIFSKRENLL